MARFKNSIDFVLVFWYDLYWTEANLMELISISVIMSSTSLIIGFLGLLIGFLALAKAVGIEKSTHQVQYVPVDPEIDKANEEYLSQVKEKNWATNDTAISAQQDMFKEDLEDMMPEFAMDDEDLKKYSF